MLAPTSAADLAEMIRATDAPLSVQGGGTRGMARPGQPLTTSGITGIVEYTPGALTLIARAGTPIAEIEAALDAEEQMLAFEPMDHRSLLGTGGTPTIGGVVAANVSGPRRVRAGACRDFILGVRFVDGTGAVAQNGGKVMKNVTGYDLSKLMTGARGTLGVLTEISLKVLPKPKATATLSLHDIAPDQAVPAMSAALGTPYEVSGAFFGPYSDQGPRVAHIRLEGLANSVTYRVDRLKDVLGTFGTVTVETDPDRNAAIWRGVRDLNMLKDMPFVACSGIKASVAPAILETIGQTHTSTDFLDWGGARIWHGASEDQLVQNAEFASDPSERKNPDAGAADLSATLSGMIGHDGGHTTVIKGPDVAKQAAISNANPTVHRLNQGLRAKFDPRGILNGGPV